MYGILDKRKRSREDDVLCEITPLHKRINNLHQLNFEQADFNQQLNVVSNNDYNLLCKDMITSEDTSIVNHKTFFELDNNLRVVELNESQNPFNYLNRKLIELQLAQVRRWSF